MIGCDKKEMESTYMNSLKIDKTSALTGIKNMIPLLPSVGLFGFIFGFTGGLNDLPFVLISSSSFIIFAGSAQFIVLLLIVRNEPFIAIILSGIIINLRHVLYGAALQKDISATGIKKLLLAYLLTDEAFLVTMLVKNSKNNDEKIYLDDVLFGSGALLWLIWNISTIIGFISLSIVDLSSLNISLEFIVAATFSGYLINHFRDMPSERKFISIITISSFFLSFFLQSSTLLIITLLLGCIIAILETYFKANNENLCILSQ